MLRKHEMNLHENNNAEVQSQQKRFATLLKSNPRTDIPSKISSTSAEHSPPGEHLKGTASVCQINFKRLKLRKVLFTFFKRNLLTLKTNK